MVTHPSSAFPPQAGPWLSEVMLSLLSKLIWRVLLYGSLSTNVHQVITDQVQPRLLSWDPSAPLLLHSEEESCQLSKVRQWRLFSSVDQDQLCKVRETWDKVPKLRFTLPVLEVWTSGDWQRCPERPEFCAAVCSKLKHSVLEGRYHQINEDNEILKAQETQKVSRLKMSLGWIFQWRGYLLVTHIHASSSHVRNPNKLSASLS